MNGIITGAKWLAAIGATNWGLDKFVKINLISYLPSETIQSLAYGLVAASGIYLGYLLIQKKL